MTIVDRQPRPSYYPFQPSPPSLPLEPLSLHTAPSRPAWPARPTWLNDGRLQPTRRLFSLTCPALIDHWPFTWWLMSSRGPHSTLIGAYPPSCLPLIAPSYQSVRSEPCSATSPKSLFDRALSFSLSSLLLYFFGSLCKIRTTVRFRI